MAKTGMLKAAMMALAIGCLCGGQIALAQNSNLPGPSMGAGPQATPMPGASVAAAAPTTAGSVDDSYRLGTGDKVKVTVYGEDDLSGEFTVDGTGQIQFPLVGQVKAAGLTVRGFTTEYQEILASKYLRDPRVNVQILTYRPFYIMGEINRPGEYPYRNGLSVLGAVALAGGFTYRANDSRVFIRRNGSTEEQEVPATTQSAVNPGDIVRVRERLF